MNIFKTAALAASMAVLGTAPASMAQDDAAEPTEGEIRLKKMLEGRVAGEPQSCIRIRPNTDVTVIDKTAIVYEVGETLYVNVPRDARSVDDGDIIVRRTTLASQLCRMDIITTIDRFQGFYTGNISLTDFVPYRKVDS